MNRSVTVPTLVLGPSGSGKEIVARAIGLSAIHTLRSSVRQFASKPRDSFRPVNLSALSETLIESELFGHRKGAFTRAIRNHAGIFETRAFMEPSFWTRLEKFRNRFKSSSRLSNQVNFKQSEVRSDPFTKVRSLPLPIVIWMRR